MFPVSDVIPSRTVPYVTLALILANALTFLFELTRGAPELEAIVQIYGVVPAALAWPSVLTSMFLHGGWLHFGSNMLYLWIFGDNVEDRLGHVRYLILYVAFGVVAALGHIAMNQSSTLPMVGASGAVAGVMGAYFVLYPQSRVLTVVLLVIFLDIIEIPAIFFLGIWFLLQLFSGVGSIGAQAADGGVAFWAHVIGFASGALVGAVHRVRDAQRSWERVNGRG